MADTKVSALTSATPILTDLLYLVDDPGGTPSSKSSTVSAVRDLLEVNLVEPVVSGQSLTGAEATSLLDLSTTWNTTGTPTALKLDVTDTASNAASLLMDLQVGGSSKFQVYKDAGAIFDGNLTELRNGINAQTLNLYNTYTDGSNYERLSLGFDSTVDALTLRVENGGTGAFGTNLFIGDADTGGTGSSALAGIYIGAGAGANYSGAGLRNTFVGIDAGAGAGSTLNSSGFKDNVVLGNEAGYYLTTAPAYNTLIGAKAGYRLGDGDYNVMIGYQTHYGVAVRTAINEAVIIGSSAGSKYTGDGNIAIGYLADNLTTSGEFNIVIGYDIDPDSATASNQINIGSKYFHDRILLAERSSNPTAPAEGQFVIWMSDGTGHGADGDVLIASTAGGTTNYSIIFDHSAGTTF